MKDLKMNLRIGLVLFLIILLGASIFPGIQVNNIVNAADSCPWYCFRGNTKRTGVVKLDCGPQSKELSYLWEYKAIAQIKSSAIIVDSRVFFGSEDGKMHCLEQSSGRQLWETRVDEDIHCSPVYSSGNVYFGNDSGKFYCLDGETGEIEWTFKTDGSIHSSPVIYHQRIIFGSYDNYVYCLNLSDGALKWKFETDGEVFSSPAVFEERVYIGSDDQNMYCLDFKSGEMIWYFETNQRIDATPVYTGQEVVFGSDSVYSLNSETGELNWEYPMGMFGVSSCAVAKSKVTVCRWDGMFYCLDLKSGQLLWSRIVDGFANDPSICDSTIYISTNSGWFASLDLRDGDTIWETNLGEPIKTSPAISDGLIVVGGAFGTVFCYGDELVRDCISVDVEVVDFGTVISRTDGQIEVNLINCGTNDIPVEYEVVGDWFSVKRFPSGAIPRRQRRHFYVYMLSQSIGLEKIYTGKLILKWAGKSKEINVRVFVDNTIIPDEDYCNWESYQSSNTGNGDLDISCSPERDSLARRYNIEFPDFLVSQPLVSDRDLIVSRHSGVISCLDELNGKSKWEFSSRGTLFSTPAVSNNKVYYSTTNGAIGCLDKSTGKPIWQIESKQIPKTALRVWREYIFFIDEENKLVSLSSKDGKFINSFTPNGSINNPPTVASAKVFFGTDAGTLYCLSVDDITKPVWTKNVRSSIESGIAYKNGDFCFGTNNGLVYNINSNTGRTLWVKRFNSSVSGDIVTTDDSVYCTTKSNTLYSICRDEGIIKWKLNSWDRILAGPVVSGNHVFISADTRFYMIAADDGHILWSDDFIREIRWFSAGIGKVFATCQDKNIYCLVSEPYIKFSPKILNFGSLRKAQKETTHLLIKNTTDHKVTVKISTTDDWFKLSENIFSINDGENKKISITTIQHQVNDPGIKSGSITADWGDDSANVNVWAYIMDREAYQNWSSFGADNNNSRNNSESMLNLENLKLDWEYKTNAPVLSCPMLSNGRLYFGSNDSDLRCLDAENSMLLWSYNTGKSIVATGSLVDKYVFFGSEDGYVYCLDGSTGQIVWKFFTGGIVSSIATNVNSRKAEIFFGTSQGKFFCLTYKFEEEDYEVNWTNEYNNPIDCAPVTDTEHVYFTTTSGDIYCVKKSSGKEEWNSRAFDSRSSPILIDNKLIIQTLFEGVYCFSKSKGREMWRNSSIYGATSFCSTGSDIIGCGSNGWIASINPENGEMNWIQDIQTPINSTPVTDGYSVFVSDMEGKIRAFNIDTGSLKWNYDLEMPIISSPAIWNGRLYVGCSDSKIYCFSQGK
ncbi:MAG: PQQ-binding-like beta-propeller repeat protein [Caldisericia bacterium]